MTGLAARISMLLVFGILPFLQSEAQTPQEHTSDTPAPGLKKGEMLAEQFCTSCHLRPPAEILPREKWPFVITWMGNYLGHKNTTGVLANLVHLDRIPAEPIVSREELKTIEKFYTAAAPEKPLPPPDKSNVIEGLDLFRPWKVKLMQGDRALISLVKIDEQHKRLFIGDGLHNQLLAFSPDGKLRERHKAGSQPIALTLDGQSFYLTLIGDLDRDRRRGQIIYYERQGNTYALKGILNRYYRTAHTLFTDLNGDRRDDIVVSAFGDYDKGSFSWFENVGDGYQEHVLIERSGALQAEAHDWTGDGLPDLMVLMAQGRNELLVFTNQGGGRFEERQVLEQFPGFGYHSFQSVDFNRDGHRDVITVNGNNMEMEDPPLRNYHGIRLYLNDGNMNFTERFFYPMHGAIKAIAADFDQDGDFDIAAISFFPDWSSEKPEGFVFLDNQGHYNFIARTIPESYWGRWMTMDAGDLEGDGDLDLVLGNAFILSGMSKEYQSKFARKFQDTPPVLILKNILRP